MKPRKSGSRLTRQEVSKAQKARSEKCHELLLVKRNALLQSLDKSESHSLTKRMDLLQKKPWQKVSEPLFDKKKWPAARNLDKRFLSHSLTKRIGQQQKTLTKGFWAILWQKEKAFACTVLDKRNPCAVKKTAPQSLDKRVGAREILGKRTFVCTVSQLLPDPWQKGRCQRDPWQKDFCLYSFTIAARPLTKG